MYARAFQLRTVGRDEQQGPGRTEPSGPGWPGHWGLGGCLSVCLPRVPQPCGPTQHSIFRRENLRGITYGLCSPCNVDDDRNLAHREHERGSSSKEEQAPWILLAGPYFHTGADRRMLSGSSWDQQPLTFQQQMHFYFKKQMLLGVQGLVCVCVWGGTD